MGIDDADAVDGAADSPVQRARTMHVATSLCRLGELRATVRGDAVCMDFEGALSWVLGQRRVAVRSRCAAEDTLQNAPTKNTALPDLDKLCKLRQLE